MMELGGNITLSGFNELDRDTMVVVKKIIGSYVRKVSDKNSAFQSLSVTLKTTHERENSAIYEVKTQLVADKQYNAECQDRNLMFCIDKALKKLENAMEA
ncbi:MAG: hypothetical protein ACOCQG_06305 [Candidatus Nanoarchaeia archaeon]